jgi:hypothetical protein
MSEEPRAHERVGTSVFDFLLSFLNRLDQHDYRYSLEHERSDAILVRINAPDERWEAQIFADGHVELEVFTGTGELICGPDASTMLERLFANIGSDA